MLCTSLRLFVVALCLTLAACREPIIHNLSETDANRLITKLHGAQIDAKKERQPDGKWFVSTAQSDSIRALRHLDEVRFLRGEPTVENTDQSMFSSRADKRLRAERALAREIEHSLLSIGGILEAHVHLNTPPLDPLFGGSLRTDRGSASAVLVVDQQSGVDKADIQQLIAGATGVEDKAISVLISRGVVTPATPRSEVAPEPSHAAGIKRETLLWVAGVLVIVALSMFLLLSRSRVSLKVFAGAKC